MRPIYLFLSLILITIIYSSGSKLSAQEKNKLSLLKTKEILINDSLGKYISAIKSNLYKVEMIESDSRKSLQTYTDSLIKESVSVLNQVNYHLLEENVKTSIQGFNSFLSNRNTDITNSLTSTINNLSRAGGDNGFSFKFADESFTTYQEDVLDTLSSLEFMLSDYAEQLIIKQSDESTPNIKPEEPERKQTEFIFSTSFSNRIIWRGIDQNAGKGASTTSLVFSHRSGISLSAGFVGIQGAKPIIDQTTFNLSYNYDITESISVGVGYDRFNYRDSSVQLKSNINQGFNFNCLFENSIVTTSAIANYLLSEPNNDIAVTLSFSHAFIYERFLEGSLLIIPSINAEFGTLNSISARVNRLGQTSSVVKSAPFVVTNYDINLSCVYTINGFIINPQFIYTIPINTDSKKITRIVPTGVGNNFTERTFQLSPEAKKTFYGSLTLSYQF